MDWDRNGSISRTEFKSYLQEMKKGEEVDIDEVHKAFKHMDKNQDNQISWDEFYVSRDMCKVFHWLVDWGLVDLDLGCSTILHSYSAVSAKIPSDYDELGR